MFSTLWVGPPITKVQEVCLSSFVYYGHDISVYVYDMSIELPKGVKKEDARTIFPEGHELIQEKCYGQFSDLFRYTLIHLTDTVWVDADTLCLTKDLHVFNAPYVFPFASAEQVFVQGILKAPKNSPLILDLVQESLSANLSEKKRWSAIGTLLFNKLVKKYQLNMYAVPPEISLVITYLEWDMFWRPEDKETILEKTHDAYFASLYTSAIKVENRNSLPKGSAIEHFYQKFVAIG